MLFCSKGGSLLHAVLHILLFLCFLGMINVRMPWIRQINQQIKKLRYP